MLGVVGLPLLVALVLSQVLTDYPLVPRSSAKRTPSSAIQEVKLLLVLVVGGFTASFLIGNAWLATRYAPSPVSRRFVPAAVAGCVLIAAMIGWSARGNWQAFLLWVHQQPFGVEDPLHHRDIGFFVFSLPFLQKLSNLLILIAALGSVVAIVIHTLTGAVNWRPLRATHPARVHLALLGSLCPAPARLAPAPGDLLG